MKLLLIGLKNQTQCHHTPIPSHTILHLMVAAVQYPFQLCQQRSLLYSFCTFDHLARTIGENKKKSVLPLFVNVKALLFSV
jgi:hypothetical protein